MLQKLANRSLLAALALALAIGAGLASGSEPAAAESAEDSATITTTLHPGWNLIGWVGPEAPVADLFEAIPALQRVSARDAQAGAYVQARRRGGSATGDLKRVNPGMGLWFWVGGNETIEWTRPAGAESALAPLHRGFNLVAWFGGPLTPEHALARLGDDLARASQWNSEAQRFEMYDPDAARTAGALALGDGLWIDVSSAVYWWPQGTDPPPVVFVDDLDAATAIAIATGYQRARSLLAKRFGVPTAAEVTVYIYADTESVRAAYRSRIRGELTKGCNFRYGTELHHSASCYGPPGTRVGSRYLDAAAAYIAPATQIPTPAEGYIGYGPRWLLRGMDAYVDAAYRAEFGGEAYDQLRPGLIAGARVTTSPLSSMETVDGQRAAGVGVTAAMGFLAVELLTEHAGERSLSEYFRHLPSSETWQEAFGEAFKISISGFYEAFEVARIERAPLLPHLADPLDEPAFVFVGDIAEDVQKELRASLDASRDLIAAEFGSKASDFTIYIGSDEEALMPEYLAVRGFENPELCGDYALKVIFQIITCKNRDLVLAHEYVHVLQNQLAEGASWGPAWLTEGVAVYGEALHRAIIGQGLTASEGLELRRRWELARVMVAGDVPTLSSLETVDDPAERSHYRLGFIAADWLAQRSGGEALTDYYRQLPSSETWHDAFEGAFDITVGDFYTEFEDYWPEIDPLLPHLSDDREGPVVVFLGQVDSIAQAAHRSAVEKVEALFFERFGVVSVESTAFVGANVESLEPIHWMLFEQEPQTDFCYGRTGPALAYAASCDDPLARYLGRFYFLIVRDELAPWSEVPVAANGYSRWGPQWLYLGALAYADLLSLDAAGIADYEDERTARVAVAQASTAGLRTMEASEGWDAANEANGSGWTLGFLAVERLAELADDEAVFEYFRLLPSSASWREPFEGAFGLTVDDFYEAFEAYLAELLRSERSAS